MLNCTDLHKAHRTESAHRKKFLSSAKDSEETYNKVICLTSVTSAFANFILQHNQVFI